MPHASLTDVLVRAMSGPKGGLREPDVAPPRPPEPPIEIDYPRIATQPEYAAAVDKLNHFANQKAEAEAKLASLYKQIEMAAKNVEPRDEDAIGKAEALLAGEAHGINLQAEIQATNKLIEALRAALDAQHVVLRRINGQLSRAAGQRYEEEHKKRVKRLMAAIDELYAANQAEQALRFDLVRLGYDGSSLPAMNFRNAEDPKDRNGNYTFYWYREAAQYSRSAEEAATEVRKARLKSVLGE